MQEQTYGAYAGSGGALDYTVRDDLHIRQLVLRASCSIRNTFNVVLQANELGGHNTKGRRRSKLMGAHSPMCRNSHHGSPLLGHRPWKRFQ